ncbi:hypothetical protein Cadr_000018742 [Camelus dromedarius]|uniref:Uncharacterized protein n=1 Tax=Camelus dromedarius TaxID=9838 RepID=A0A5N4D5U9_CAMDR|nr:hypothetical protein Cadr_000018742 [Camelus dromedarius]
MVLGVLAEPSQRERRSSSPFSKPNRLRVHLGKEAAAKRGQVPKDVKALLLNPPRPPIRQTAPQARLFHCARSLAGRFRLRVHGALRERGSAAPGAGRARAEGWAGPGLSWGFPFPSVWSCRELSLGDLGDSGARGGARVPAGISSSETSFHLRIPEGMITFCHRNSAGEVDQP